MSMQPGLWRRAALLAWTTLLATGAAAKAPGLSLSSNAFADHRPIPGKYTCDGANVSPPLQWGGVPDTTRSLVLIVDDPDAPDPAAPKVTWVHWVLFDIPPAARGLPENVARQALPPGTGEGRNSWHKTGYGGPCPPIGRHRYFFKLYALDTRLSLPEPPDENELNAAMAGHIITRTALVGTYRKSH